MPAANAYGTTNPRAFEPYPIETTLASLASAGSSANAQNMLDTYQAQRQAAEAEYGGDLDRQHEAARQQLLATMHDNDAKNALGFLKESGGLAFAQANPRFSYLTAGTDPNVMQGIIGGQTRLQDATIAEKAGAGVNSATQAGFQPTGEVASGLTGMTGLVARDPVSIQAAKIAADAKLKAAAMSANKPPPGIGFSVQLPTAATGGVPMTANVPGKLGADAGLQQLRDRGFLPQPGQVAAGQVAPPADDAQPKGRTGLAAAPASRGGGGGGATSNDAHQQQQAQQVVETVMKQKAAAGDAHAAEAYKQVKAAMAANNGRVPIIMGANGQPVGFRGADGKQY